MAACSQLDSCERCVAQQPSRLDVGVRCVWCASLAACLDYTKHSFLFPCPDALRPGGGYPGGSSCTAKHARPPESETHSSVMSKPSSRRHFTYIAHTAEPLTIVIASFGRPSNLPTALAYLLQLEPLGRAGSELIVSHGSRRSFLSAAACDAQVDAACAGAAAPGCYGATVRHLNSTMLNDRYYAAQRFFAAHEAANNAVVLHLDDDLVPTQPMLQALIDHVALEPGFPLYSAKEGSNFSPGLYGPSSFTRSCGPLGYTRGHQQVRPGHPAVLTNLAATARVSNARFVDTFLREGYESLMRATHGNGEDLLFSYHTARSGGRRLSVGVCTDSRLSRDSCGLQAGEFAWIRGDEADESSAAQHQAHKQPHHYDVRDALCRCLSTDVSGENLPSCAVGKRRASMPAISPETQQSRSTSIRSVGSSLLDEL